MIHQLIDQLLPLLRAALDTLLEFYQQRMAEITRAYEARVSSIGAELLRGIGNGLCELALANLALTIVVGAAAVGGIYLYIQHCWRKFRWRGQMLEEAREQTRLLRELYSQLPKKGGSDKAD